VKITKKIIIEKSSDSVWNTFVEEFDDAYKWMSGVTHSHKIKASKEKANTPISGRVCKLDNNDDSFFLIEEITNYDKKNYTFDFQVLPQNAPILLPVKKMNHNVILRKLSSNQTEVTWNASPELKTHGKILSPLLAIGFGQFFGQILKELKHFSETGTPHPKKVKCDSKNSLKRAI